MISKMTIAFLCVIGFLLGFLFVKNIYQSRSRSIKKDWIEASRLAKKTSEDIKEGAKDTISQKKEDIKREFDSAGHKLYDAGHKVSDEIHKLKDKLQGRDNQNK